MKAQKTTVLLLQSFSGPHTKRPKTKRPKGQNVTRDKTSQGTTLPRDKMSQGQNVPRDKKSLGTKRPSGQMRPIIYVTCVANYLIQ